MSITPLHKVRFDALAGYTRKPDAELMGEEVAWFSATKEYVLGVIIKDLEDEDFLYVVLGRDKNKRFRCIDFSKSVHGTMDIAIEALISKLNDYEESSQSEFPQGDESRRRIDLFRHVAHENQLHEGFKQITENIGYSPAVEIMREMSFHFEDIDGNFVQQFQTTGFDQRIFELYLFGVLNEAGFSIDRSFSAPDFTCFKFGYPVCIEATTVNKTDGTKESDVRANSPEESAILLKDYYPIKYGSALYSKLTKLHQGKRYWELPHVQNKPFLLAVHDFQGPFSMTYTRSALPTYLYGIRHICKYDNSGKLLIVPEKVMSHKFADKEIPSGFFFQEDSENISAVLFSNSGTISKFNRIGFIAGFGSRKVKMVRKGLYLDHDPNASTPLEFYHEVHDPTYNETWTQGVDIFHNPNARVPLDPDYLRNDIAHHFLEDGQIISYTPKFHPLSSFTNIAHP